MSSHVLCAIFNCVLRIPLSKLVYFIKIKLCSNHFYKIFIFTIFKDRTVVIATYALCGFSNISSIGIMLGGLGAMAPSRKTDLSTIVVRAMIAGNVACFMTACIAGKTMTQQIRLVTIRFA